MNGELFKRAIRFINENKRRKFWFRLGSALAAVVVFVTTYALILPAITVSNDTVCGLEEHTHMYSCYDHAVVGQTKEMICGDTLPEIHEHSDLCYNTDGKLTCGYADYIFHEHSEICYNSQGELVCKLPEHKKHTHTKDCYETKTVLVCEIDENSENDADAAENQADDSASVSAFEGTGESTAHTHSAECYQTQEILICGEICDTHTHSDDCYDGDSLVCGKTEISEHRHTDACFEMTGGTEKDTLICTKPEHKHSEDCYAKNSDGDENAENATESTESGEQNEEKKEVSESFEYEDDEISMSLTVVGDEKLPDTAELKVDDLSENSDEYKAYSTYTEEIQASDSDRLIAKEVTLVKDGQALDLSDYSLTAEVTVKDKVIEPIKKKLEKLSDAAPEALIGVEIIPLEEDGGEVSQGEGIVLTTDETDKPVTLSLDNGIMAISTKATANPNYQVQYYANLPTFASSGNKALTVIDTSGAVLPKNNSTIKTKSIYLNKTNAKTTQNNGHATDIYKVATQLKLTEIYKTDSYEYITAPNPMYVDKLSDNAGYNVTAIWVLKSGKSASSTNSSDWNVYSADAHFTNRESVAASDIIYITDGTVIRLIYNCVTTSFTTPTTFYDYNITNGQRNSSGSYYTATAGINSKENYPAKSENGLSSWSTHNNLLAFGNINTGTGLGFYLFDSGRLNAFNLTNYGYDKNTQGCTFGLVKRYDFSTEKLVYDPWIIAPNLFNEGSAKGKVTYEDSSITFERTGDTYTISSVSVNDNGATKTINNLQEFFNPSPTTNSSKYPSSSSNGIYTGIFTNNFWPLDNVKNKTDPMFGDFDNPTKYVGYAKDENAKPDSSYSSTAVEVNFPDSDDGNPHNSYFGMQYAIEFMLTEDYLGPLEYVFYGDDDMWVFLDETLVCDIGGVHSSVGEYVNLWDYLEPEKGNGTHKHRLTVFYTERGASGSTCYMNFTLPSVTNINIDQKATNLRIEKEVVGESDPTQEFSFDINIFDSTGVQIKDDYAYKKYDAEGNELTHDLIIHDGSSFTLKNGEYIIIDYLPYGTRYTITEVDPAGYTVSSKINGVVQSGNTAKGTIIMDVLNRVQFTNTVEKVDLTLQKLDASGEPLSGAIFSLTDENGNTVNFVKNSDGTYTVPTESTQLFDTEQEYYIALNMDDNYVLAADMSDTDTYNVQLQKKTGGNNQKYKIYIQADGSCSFQNVATERWIDHQNGLLDNATNVQHWTDGSVPTVNTYQKWYLILNTDGSLKIKPRRAVLNKNAAVLELNGATVAQGQNIHLYEDNGTNAQKWKLVPVNEKEAIATTTQIEVGSDGILKLSGLFPGTYTLTETAAPYGYDGLDGEIKINVAKDGSVTVTEANPLVSVDSEDGLILKVKNLKTVKELTIKKEVVGSDTDEKFEFDISYTVGDGEAINQTVNLKNGESTVIKIPAGAYVTVSETHNRDFTVSFDSNMPIEPNGNICSFTISENTTLTAVNTAAGIVLPATGGNGTYMYTIAGAAMIIVSLALMYRNKKSKKEKIGIL